MVLQMEGALFLGLVILMIALTVSSPYFLTAQNITSILEAVAVDGIIAAFSTMVMVMGGLDLSAVGVMVLASVVSGLLVNQHIQVVWAVGAALCIGLLFGLLNAGLVTVVGINAFIATLATWLVASGLGFVLSSGQSSAISNPSFLALAGVEPFLKVPVLVLVMLASFIVVWFILRTTRYGLHLYAIGGGASAAALSGVRVRRVQVTTYVISGVMSSVAGILLASWSQASVPTSTAGNDLLTILAAIILGGVSLTGGAGSPIGTFLGVVFLGVINNALVLWQVSDFYQPVITGIVLILAVSGSAYRQRRRAVTS
jgi:ribose transport system permease protein